MTQSEEFGARNDRFETAARVSEFDSLLVRLAAAADPEAREGVFRALAQLVVDATLDGDEPGLNFAVGEFQRRYGEAVRTDSPNLADAETRGRLLGLIDITQRALEAVLPLSLLAEFEVSSHHHGFLAHIAEEPGSTNRAIEDAMDLDDTYVSKVGRRLELAGAARKRRLGRKNHWEITPRGLKILGVLNDGGIERPKREHRQRV
jgi:DNA-binding MarR family transcriptional regulator